MKDNRFKVTSFKDIEIEDVNWLWFPYFPLGKISFLAGDPGVGKSFISTFLASVISKGERFPFSEDTAPIGNVIIQTGEDGKGDTIKKRLVAFQTNCELVHIIELKKEYEESDDLLLTDIPELDSILNEYKPKLFVFDPITTFLGDINMSDAIKVRKVLRPIGKLAEKYNCAIVFVIHRNKGVAGGNQLHRLLGSIDFAGIARSVVSVGTRKDTKEVLFMHTKSNLAKIGQTLALKIDNDKLEWLGTRDYQQDDELLNVFESKKTTRDIACDFIIEYLTSNGKSKYIDMVEKAREYNITEKTLNRARDDLKDAGFIDKENQGREVYWYLVEDI